MKCFIIIKVEPGNEWVDVLEKFVAAYPTLDAALDQACATFGAKFDSFAGGLPYRSLEKEDGSWYEIWRGSVKRQELEFDQSYRSLYTEGKRND